MLPWPARRYEEASEAGENEARNFFSPQSGDQVEASRRCRDGCASSKQPIERSPDYGCVNAAEAAKRDRD
jgi:hypothetical protein